MLIPKEHHHNYWNLQSIISKHFYKLILFRVKYTLHQFQNFHSNIPVYGGTLGLVRFDHQTFLNKKSEFSCVIVRIRGLNLLRYKNSLNKKILFDTVYRCTCSNCEVTYYGKTYCNFFTRAAEHMNISNLTGKRLESLKQSAISAHLLECSCSIEFVHFNIPACDEKRFRLFINKSYWLNMTSSS